MSDLEKVLDDNDRWMREVLTDFRIAFDDHKIGRRLAFTQWMCDRQADLAAARADVARLRHHIETAIRFIQSMPADHQQRIGLLVVVEKLGEALVATSSAEPSESCAMPRCENYTQLRDELFKLPLTWYPDLLRVIVNAAIDKRVFQAGRCATFVATIEGTLSAEFSDDQPIAQVREALAATTAPPIVPLADADAEALASVLESIRTRRWSVGTAAVMADSALATFRVKHPKP
jgi:hypothetical protein